MTGTPSLTSPRGSGDASLHCAKHELSSTSEESGRQTAYFVSASSPWYVARFLDSRRPSGWGPWERFPVASRAGPGSPIRRSAIWPQRNGARGRDGPSVNPLAQVPTLVLPGGQVMTESAAITLHLADATPVGSCAYPSEFQPGTSLRRGTGRYHAINDLGPARIAKVANLLDQFEFDVVDTGPLGEERRFQKDSPRMACPSNPRSCERRALPPIT
jgi:hypothetical protein